MSPPSVDLWTDTWTSADVEEARRLHGPIWVVGATGFVGAKLFASLSRVRDDVFAISRHVDTSWRLVHCPYPNRIPLDVTQPRDVNAAVKKHRPRTIFNLSAYGAYERQSNAAQIHLVNYTGTLNMIVALLESGCDAFVQAGSSSEYGLNCAGPAETDQLMPNSDYAVSKVASSYLMQFYGKLRDFPCTHLRLYSVYGPWEERDRLIPRLIEQGLQGKYPPLVNADISRDFVYVDDCNLAFVRAALVGCTAQRGGIFNVSTGQRTTLAELAQVAKSHFQIESEPVFGSMPKRKWDTSNWYGNPAHTTEKLGWKAQKSLAEGLELTVAWEKLAQKHVRIAVPPSRRERLSAVVACYRDHQAIPVMYERLSQAFTKIGVDYEIIFVNDRSPTEDEAVIRDLCEKDSRVLGISHSRNFGSQSAFLSGMGLATGDGIILLDGDLQDPPEVIPEFYEKWRSGFDIVYGVRAKRDAPLHMQILYKAFYRVFKHLSDIEIPVDAGDFSLIDRKVVEHLLRFPERDVFLRGLRAWVGFKQTGVVYVRPERMFGRTTNNFSKNIWWAKKAIFSFSLKPLNYIQGLGFAIFGISLALAAYYLGNYFVNPPPSGGRGTTTIILLVLALGGIQLFCLSVLGDYVSKVLEESKARPKYIRAMVMKQGEIFASEPEIDEVVRAHRRESLERAFGTR